MYLTFNSRAKNRQSTSNGFGIMHMLCLNELRLEPTTFRSRVEFATHYFKIMHLDKLKDDINNKFEQVFLAKKYHTTMNTE